MHQPALPAAFLLFASCAAPDGDARPAAARTVALSEATLRDKIRGGFAGQLIGCTYGGPTEFRYRGEPIPAAVTIAWDATRMAHCFDHSPGLYDDLYMDLTFLAVLAEHGLQAPAARHAAAFAAAGYPLWHANQAARYNIQHGIAPPASGHWQNNPHADDIDFQIEADFAGLVSPGMVGTSSELCDRVGHIMNHGDGYYGGVYVAAMYALAFVHDDIGRVVQEALAAIPRESTFHRCMTDVIGWHAQHPDDWRQTWALCEQHWANDIGCPDGALRPFDIDAKLNAAYILIGLLYGNGDFGRTIDISTRCGQDSDCNPASACGILGTMLGYTAIPAHWQQGIERVEQRPFAHTSLSLQDACTLSHRLAVANVLAHGGAQHGERITIAVQEPHPVPLEQSFPGMQPVERRPIDPAAGRLEADHDRFEFAFTGTGFVLLGGSRSQGNREVAAENEPEVEVHIDGVLHERAPLPLAFTRRRHDVTWKYDLAPEHHVVRVRYGNPVAGVQVELREVLLYATK
jgi:hypothetical protein